MNTDFGHCFKQINGAFTALKIVGSSWTKNDKGERRAQGYWAQAQGLKESEGHYARASVLSDSWERLLLGMVQLYNDKV